MFKKTSTMNNITKKMTQNLLTQIIQNIKKCHISIKKKTLENCPKKAKLPQKIPSKDKNTPIARISQGKKNAPPKKLTYQYPNWSQIEMFEFLHNPI